MQTEFNPSLKYWQSSEAEQTKHLDQTFISVPTETYRTSSYMVCWDSFFHTCPKWKSRGIVSFGDNNLRHLTPPSPGPSIQHFCMHLSLFVSSKSSCWQEAPRWDVGRSLLTASACTNLMLAALICESHWWPCDPGTIEQGAVNSLVDKGNEVIN